MFLGLREHEVRSNPWYHGGKTPFAPGIILIYLIIKLFFMIKQGVFRVYLGCI